jgi:hypothetical protein
MQTVMQADKSDPVATQAYTVLRGGGVLAKLQLSQFCDVLGRLSGYPNL